ncbi:c-type cytochrome [Comamonas guangdongensis]|uniref:C-type cytochrome n=1 Tax=Comamonas guangdongensis TaxID=510515 RepID=A0ABV3ZWX4_9BURK
MKLLASLLTAAIFAAPAFPAFSAGETPAKVDAAKGQASYGAVCAACHAADGNSSVPLQPKLAGQHPEYLVKQLREFKDGKRNDPVMKGFASALSDGDMQNIAAWLHTQAPKNGFSKDKDLIALGERIYRGGIQERQIAACAGCHSPNGVGIPAQYPRLSGQHSDYTVKTLTAFRDGTRGNSIPMAQVAAKLNDREIKAVADYIAGLR